MIDELMYNMQIIYYQQQQLGCAGRAASPVGLNRTVLFVVFGEELVPILGVHTPV